MNKNMRIRPVATFKIPKKPCAHDDLDVDGIEVYCRNCNQTVGQMCFDCKGSGVNVTAEEVEHQCTNCGGLGWKPY